MENFGKPECSSISHGDAVGVPRGGAEARSDWQATAVHSACCPVESAAPGSAAGLRVGRGAAADDSDSDSDLSLPRRTTRRLVYRYGLSSSSCVGLPVTPVPVWARVTPAAAARGGERPAARASAATRRGKLPSPSRSHCQRVLGLGRAGRLTRMADASESPPSHWHGIVVPPRPSRVARAQAN